MMNKYNLIGEYDCKIDAKGRIKMPANLLKQLASTGTYEFVVNRGYEQHLVLYPQDVWDKKTKELDQLNINIKKHRQLLRYFHRGATQLSTDASERILIPKSLIRYAGIGKEVVLFSFRDQVEIWDKGSYKDFIENEKEDFSDIAEEVFGSDNPFRDGGGIS